MAQQPQPGITLETVLIAVGSVVMGAGAATWIGANLASRPFGGRADGTLSDWLTVTGRLLSGEPPEAAWGPLATGIPHPIIYWTCTALTYLLLIAVTVGLVWGWRRLDPARTPRKGFGQDTDTHQATRRDVRPLVIDNILPPPGRMLLGRLAPKGPLLATENPDDDTRLRGNAARRQGNRGSVALIGPTGSGKTALAIAAITTWQGPVVAVSVKRDLYDTTIAARRNRGDIAVFDPGGATGLLTARWSPLEATTTSTGALRTGRALAQAIPRAGVTNADYWAEHGEGLLGAFMSIAGLARLLHNLDDAPRHDVGMETLATWVRTIAGAADPVINELLHHGLNPERPLEVQLLARHAATNLIGIGREDHKIRSSVYATAVLALKPWLEPAVAHSASTSPYPDYTHGGQAWPKLPAYVGLDWLMAGGTDRANTLYLAASTTEFERLSPVLGGLLADLKDTIHGWDIAGRRLEKPLLIVIDEAAQLQLGWLPTEVSTIAALGATLVTCWQNLAQIQHRYGTLADAVLSGHRTKCFFAGIDDASTSRYLTTQLGHEHVERLTISTDLGGSGGGPGAGRRSLSRTLERQDLATPATIRQLYPGHAIMLHGTLPPIHLNALRWWTEKRLTDLVQRDERGRAKPPDEVVTCPLGDVKAAGTSATVDSATLTSTRAQLPKVKRAPDAAVVKHRPPKQINDQPTLFDDAEAAAPPSDPPVAGPQPDLATTGRCALCFRSLEVGQGRTDRRGKRTIVRCAPDCSPGG